MSELPSLTERLTAAGVPVSSAVQRQEPESPWFIKALLALAGWVAAVFILIFIAIGFEFLIDNSAAAILLGVVMIATAYALLRLPGNDFVEHLALAVSLAGQLSVAWGTGSLLGGPDAGFWWSLVILQAVLAAVMPNFVHRVFSSFCAILALSLAMTGSGAPFVAGALTLLALIWLWLHEFQYPRRLRQVQALGYGLALGLLAIQYFNRFDRPLLGWRAEPDIWTQPWMGELIFAVALVYLLWHLLRQAERPVSRAIQTGVYGGAGLLVLASLQAYGLTQGAVLLVLGFAIGNRLLMGLGVVSLLFSISSYYYLLEVTLLTKTLTLLVLGILLLAGRWLMQRLAREALAHE